MKRAAPVSAGDAKRQRVIDACAKAGVGSYHELQQRARTLGIAANQSADILQEAIAAASPGWCKETGCFNQQALNSNFCPLHRCKAASQTCVRGARSRGLCFEHAPKCKARGCGDVQPNDSEFCCSHQCSRCTSGISRGGYCSKHEPKCEADGCSVPQAQPSKYCPAHQCAHCFEQKVSKGYCLKHVPTCKAKGCHNSQPSNSQCCPSHQCVIAGCRELKELKGYCLKHALKCQAQGCSDRQLGGSQYCDTHKCKHCQNAIFCTWQRTCTTHAIRCKAAACQTLQPKNSKYCTRHQCLSCYDGIVKDGLCSAHQPRCGASGCANPKPDVSAYCGAHQCIHCYNERVHGMFCHTHAPKCAAQGCSGYKPNSSDYCSSHQCKRCYNAWESQYNSKYCSACCPQSEVPREQWSELLRKRLQSKYGLSANHFMQQFDYDYSAANCAALQGQMRGIERFYPPQGWTKIALMVTGIYPDGDKWLDKDSGWPVVYHGTRTEAHVVKDIIMNGLKVNGGQAAPYHAASYGTGIYCSPLVETADCYTQQTNQLAAGDRQHRIVFMCRVRPWSYSKKTDFNHPQPNRRGVWLVRNSSDLRPVAVLLQG